MARGVAQCGVRRKGLEFRQRDGQPQGRTWGSLGEEVIHHHAHSTYGEIDDGQPNLDQSLLKFHLDVVVR